jgi:hypothetical protein
MSNDSTLSPSFARLSKPAQRALINARIFEVKDLARHSRAEVAELHGIGPSAFPVLESALAAAKLNFKADERSRKR